MRMSLVPRVPSLIVLVGIPLSGKDTFLRRAGFEGYGIFSRDDIMARMGSGHYREDFSSIPSKMVDRLFFSALSEASGMRRSVVVNATNLTKARRRKVLLRFPDYVKHALVFPLLDYETFCKRNERRSRSGGKHIPLSVHGQMCSVFEEVEHAEGFDSVTHLSEADVEMSDVFISRGGTCGYCNAYAYHERAVRTKCSKCHVI